MKLLFIVGASRSGSKMIRDMLNSIDSVCITSVEMKIIPDLLTEFVPMGALSGKDLQNLYKKLEASTYSLTMHRNGKHYQFENFLYENNMKGIIEILKNYICVYEGKNSEIVNVFGDKTPSYHKKLGSLDKIQDLVDVKITIINMVRDPRDVALSFKRSWGKSLYRSAYKWNQSVSDVLDYIRFGKINIKIIRYEDVLRHTEKVTDQILSNIEVTVENKKNLWQYKSSEVYGSASGYVGIKKDNIKKYESEMTDNQIEEIEAICYTNMKKFSYPILLSKESKNINKILLGLLYVYDNIMYINHILFKERGIKEGSKFLAKTYRRFINERIV